VSPILAAPPACRHPAWATHDPRVLIHEPAKWAAGLRATGDAGSRVLFRPELGAGAHTGPAGRSGRLDYEAEILAFVVDAASRPDAQAPETATVRG
jgi:oligopeptidase B